MKPVSDFLTLLASRLGQAYVLGARVPKNDPNWAGAWDCAELVTWAAFQVTGHLYGVADPKVSPRIADAYSGHWATLAAARPECALSVAHGRATPGVVLIRRPQAAGMSGHVAVSTGGGQTIEAYDSKRGVIASTSDGRRWDHAWMIPGLAYEARDAIPTSEPVVLQIGSRGELVAAVQRALAGAGFSPGAADGIYGPRTADAAAKFQAARHLVPDGEVGPITLRALGLST
jgi:N-acetylmuramoyl-L-alanine amidase